MLEPEQEEADVGIPMGKGSAAQGDEAGIHEDGCLRMESKPEWRVSTFGKGWMQWRWETRCVQRNESNKINIIWVTGAQSLIGEERSTKMERGKDRKNAGYL